MERALILADDASLNVGDFALGQATAYRPDADAVQLCPQTT